MPVPFFQLPWIKLVANGIPQFRVARRPMFTAGVFTEVGEPVPPQIVQNKFRLRQMYEARLIAPDGGMPPAYQIPAHRAPQPQPQPQPPAPLAVAVSQGYIPPKKRK